MLRTIELTPYMVRNPIKIHPDASVIEALDLIVTHKISGLCVVDEQNRLLGTLSELRCLRGVLSAIYNDTGVRTVTEFMNTEDLHTARITDNIVDVASYMLEHKIRRRPVIDDDGMLLGQITIRQILRAVKEYAQSPERSEPI